MKEFLEIYNMNSDERKKNRVSADVREDENGNTIATWCQIVDGVIVIKQAVADLERKHFTKGVGQENTIMIRDIRLITDLEIGNYWLD